MLCVFLKLIDITPNLLQQPISHGAWSQLDMTDHSQNGSIMTMYNWSFKTHNSAHPHSCICVLIPPINTNLHINLIHILASSSDKSTPFSTKLHITILHTCILHLTIQCKFTHTITAHNYLLIWPSNTKLLTNLVHISTSSSGQTIQSYT